MITFKHFINETANANLDVLDAKTIAKVIFTDCKEYLRESYFDPKNIRGTGLYRGVGIDAAVYPRMKFASTLNRKPKDSRKELQETLDKYFQKEFGYKFRSNGTFATFDYVDAAGYGDPYLIFPAKEFKFCYSPVIKDAYLFFDNSDHTDAPDGIKEIEKTLGYEISPDLYPVSGKEHKKEWLEIIEEYLEKAKPYTNKNFTDSRVKVKGGYPEVMIGCQYYYGLYAVRGSPEYDHRQKTEDILHELSNLMWDS